MELVCPAVKIEGRQRSPAYVRQVIRVWRAAIDRVKMDGPDKFVPEARWEAALNRLSEGGQTTLGAWHRRWK